VRVNVSVGERHLRPTIKVTPVTRERPRARQGVEERREGRLAVRALRIRIIVAAACGRQCSGPVSVPIESSRVLLFKNKVQPPRFA
jgi:hypothetical protein